VSVTSEIPPGMQGADFEASAGLGRGTGNGTIKEIKDAFKRYFQRKATPSGQWKTREQRRMEQQRVEVERTRVSLRTALSPRATPEGVPLRRWSRDTWRQL